MITFRFFKVLTPKHVFGLTGATFTHPIQRFCTLSETDLLKLHETDPFRAAQIYENRVNTIQEYNDTQALFTSYMHLRDCYFRLKDDENISKCTQKLYAIDPNHFYSNFVMGVETYDSKLQLDFLLKAEKFITHQTPSNMQAEVMYRIAGFYSRDNDIENGKRYIAKLHAINDETYKIREYVFSAYLQLNDGNTDTALQNFLQAIKFPVADESEFEAKKHALEQIAVHYAKDQMFNDALKYYLMLYNDCKYKIILIYKAICVCYKNYGA
eukprot:492656_1